MKKHFFGKKPKKSWLNQLGFWPRVGISAFLFFLFMFIARWPDVIFLSLLILLAALSSVVWVFISAFSKTQPSTLKDATRDKKRFSWGKIVLAILVAPMIWITAIVIGNSTALAISPYSQEEIAEQENRAAEAELALQQQVEEEAKKKAEEEAKKKAEEEAEKKAEEEAKKKAEEEAKKNKIATPKPTQNTSETSKTEYVWKQFNTSVEYLSPVHGMASCSDGVSGRCFQIEIRALRNCTDGVYIIANTLDSKGRVVGNTAYEVISLRSGETALVDLPIFESSAVNISPTEVNCFPR